MPRAAGRILDGAGVPVVGLTVFPYLVRNASNPQWRTVVTTDGAPQVGARYAHDAAAVLDEHGTPRKCETVRDADRRGFFEFPGGLPAGVYVLEVVDSAGSKKWAWPLKVSDTQGPQDVRIGGPSTTTNPVRPLPPIFVPGGPMLLTLTYFQGLGMSAATRAVDFAMLASRGFDGIEVWLTWPESRAPGCSIFDPRGVEMGVGLNGLKALVEQAYGYGLLVNCRIAASHLYRTGTHDYASYKALIATMGRRPDIWNHPALLGMDWANEGNERGKGDGPGLGWEHLSSGGSGEVTQACDKTLPILRQTVSIAAPADGTLDEEHSPVGPWYGSAKRKGAKFDFCAAHDPRTPHFGDDTEAYVKALRRSLTSEGFGSSFPIALTEPNRRGSGGGATGDSLNADQFRRAVQGARRAGAALWCLHHGHFNDTGRPITSQLDAVESTVLDLARSWAA